jgi:hypothetical protein
MKIETAGRRRPISRGDAPARVALWRLCFGRGRSFSPEFRAPPPSESKYGRGINRRGGSRARRRSDVVFPFPRMLIAPLPGLDAARHGGRPEEAAKQRRSKCCNRSDHTWCERAQSQQPTKQHPPRPARSHYHRRARRLRARSACPFPAHPTPPHQDNESSAARRSAPPGRPDAIASLQRSRPPQGLRAACSLLLGCPRPISGWFCSGGSHFVFGPTRPGLGPAPATAAPRQSAPPPSHGVSPGDLDPAPLTTREGLLLSIFFL